MDVYGGALADVGLTSSPFTSNRYAFAAGNPVNMIDMTGHWPSFSSIGHATLDVAGLVPGLGEPADLINGAWYAAQGNEVDAALSFASAVPIAGYGASAVKAAKYGDKAVDALRAGDNVVDGTKSIVRTSDNAPRPTGAGISDAALASRGKSLTSSPSGAKTSGSTSGAKAGGGGSPSKPPTQPPPPPAPGRSGPSPTSCKLNSFAAATPVVLADGSTEQISRLDVGDEVKAVDPATGEATTGTVSATYVNDDEALTELTFSTTENGRSRAVTLQTTSHHRIWDATAQEFVDAIALPIGHRARTDDGHVWTLSGTRSWTGAQRMYDITVDTVHTFFVTADSTPILVHNCGGPVTLSDERIDTHILPLHGPGTPANGSKFADDIEPEAFEALANEVVSRAPTPTAFNSRTGNHAHEADLGRPIGQSGTTRLRVWVDAAGRVRTMFPVG
jgi:Pretoxin HINT domain